VLDPNESADSERVLLAAGAGAGVVYHRAYDLPGAPGRPKIPDMPGGAGWRAAIEAIPARERHLHTHRGHLTFPNEIDRTVLTGETIRRYTFTGEADALRKRMDDLATRGITEIAYQPAGPDIPRELTAFARMAGLAPAP
jgi:5,10-methylenetetrahydromethanopterin reductase